MNWFWDLNLIHCLDVYLVLIFVVGSALRVYQYWAFLGLIWAMNDRWPHLLKLVKQHRNIFLTWGTILPGLLALLLSLAHMLACRSVWPQADITLAQLVEWRLAFGVVVFLGAVMIGVDGFNALQIEKWNRTQVEKQLDQAEYWLKSWTAPAVRVLTFGFIHPRRLVRLEVRQAIVTAGRALNVSLWWISLQVSLRIAFGGSLWLTYFWSH